MSSLEDSHRGELARDMNNGVQLSANNFVCAMGINEVFHLKQFLRYESRDVVYPLKMLRLLC